MFEDPSNSFCYSDYCPNCCVSNISVLLQLVCILLTELCLLCASLSSAALVRSPEQLVSRKDHQARGLQPADDRYHSSLPFIRQSC